MSLPSPAPTTGAATGILPAPGCDVCPHPAAAHDAIGRRFCQATLDSALTRGCICRSS